MATRLIPTIPINTLQSRIKEAFSALFLVATCTFKADFKYLITKIAETESVPKKPNAKN